MNMLDKFKAARRAGVSLVKINSHDPQQTMVSIYKQVVEKSTAKWSSADGKIEVELSTAPVLQWDIVRGVRAWNRNGNYMLAKLLDSNWEPPGDWDGRLDEGQAEEIKVRTALNPVAALVFAADFSPGSILFFLNLHRHIDEPAVAQATWNLRDAYKADKRMLVGIGPDMILPSELKSDIVVIDEPLPTDRELEAIITRTYKNSGIKKPLPDDILLKSVDAVAGLAAYPAENSAAMALGSNGYDLEVLGDQRRGQIKNIPGAELYAGKENFSNIIGCSNIISCYDELLRDPVERVRLILFLDEFEKAIAGSVGAGSDAGASQGVNEAFLTWTQAVRALGIMLLGVQGAGKSLSVKCAGGEFGIPILMASMSGVKGSHVGETEANIRALFKAADAMAAGGRILMVATCNQVDILSAEQMRRFRCGSYFFDFPTAEENAATWTYYKNRYGIKEKNNPESVNWVGSEIEACCEMAHLTRKPLAHTAKRIAPICRTKKDNILALKRSCSGKYISASHDGMFEFKEETKQAPAFAGQQTARAVGGV